VRGYRDTRPAVAPAIATWIFVPYIDLVRIVMKTVEMDMPHL
jgi:hypothetical protein